MATLGGMPPPGMIGKYLPHQVSGDTEKMRAIQVVRLVIADQTEARFIDEGSWLQGVIRLFLPQIAVGDAAQLGVHEGHQFIERRAISLAGTREQLGDVADERDRPEHRLNFERG